MSIESPRLLIRPSTAEDFDFIFRLQGDAELMRYIRPPEADPEVVRARMNMFLEYARNNPGLGTFIVHWKETGEKVGNCVLRHVDYTPGNDLEVGYVIVKSHWGQGLASEITRTLTEKAFAEFDVPKLVAVTDPENLASQRVLVKCGFRQAGMRFIYGSDNFEYVLDRPVTAL